MQIDYYWNTTCLGSLEVSTSYAQEIAGYYATTSELFSDPSTYPVFSTSEGQLQYPIFNEIGVATSFSPFPAVSPEWPR